MKPVNIFRLTHEVEYTYSDYEVRFYYFNKPEPIKFLKIDEDTNLEINKSGIYTQKIEKLSFNSETLLNFFNRNNFNIQGNSFYFVVDPFLKKILDTPYNEQIISLNHTLSRVEQENKELKEKQKRLENTSLNLLKEIKNFKRFPLWKRLYLAFRGEIK
jgi:single-stranded DNA-specific DHH superfamily exonuclease